MRIRKPGPDIQGMAENEIDFAAKTSDALAHPARIRMLHFILSENLARRIVTNKDIVAAFDYSQATVSQHLTKLVIGGLIETKKKGTSTCYYARVGALSTYVKTLQRIDFAKKA
jgi:ArsR family transcriptional regulator